MDDLVIGTPVEVPVNGNGCKVVRSWRRLAAVALTIIALVAMMWIIHEHGPVTDKAWEFLKEWGYVAGLTALTYIGADTYQKVKTAK